MKFLSKEMSFKVATHELDFAQNLKPSSILQYFQDLVELHSHDLNITHEQMQEHGKYWVLSRMYVEIYNQPKVGTQIIAKTFPHKPGNVEVQRSFYLLGENGVIIAKAISKWCVLDVHSKKIVKCKEYLNFSEEAFCPERALIFPTRKFDQNFEKDCYAEFVVNNSDLDINLHMNNARYGDILLNSLTYDEIYDSKICSFDISFLSQLMHGEKIKTFRKYESDLIRIDALRYDKPVFLAYVGLKKK